MSEAPTQVEKYRAIDAVNHSRLCSMDKSPRHYIAAIDAPGRDTPARARGTHVHEVVLRQPLSLLPPYQGPGRGTSEGKAAWSQWCVGNGLAPDSRVKDVTNILTTAMAVEARAMIDALESLPELKRFREGALYEEPLVGVINGVKCKGLADWLHPATRTLIDLKTIRSLGGRSSTRKMWWSQIGGMYARLVEQQFGWRPVTILIAAADYDSDVCVGDAAVFEMTDTARLHGERVVDGWLSRLVECRRTDSWPGQFPGITEIEPEPWEYEEHAPESTTIWDTE